MRGSASGAGPRPSSRTRSLERTSPPNKLTLSVMQFGAADTPADPRPASERRHTDPEPPSYASVSCAPYGPRPVRHAAPQRAASSIASGSDIPAPRP